MACLTEIVLDLPFPPSTNRIWRHAGKRVYRSEQYRAWLAAADATVMANKQYPRRKILGQFEATILLNEEAGGGDCDNRSKAVLDWLQSREIIVNDRHCRKVSVEWARPDNAPEGCRVTLRQQNP